MRYDEKESGYNTNVGERWGWFYGWGRDKQHKWGYNLFDDFEPGPLRVPIVVHRVEHALLTDRIVHDHIAL